MSDKTIRHLFNTADSISIDDEFIRNFNCDEDEHEIEIYLEDKSFAFSTESLDTAALDGQTWSLHCEEHNKNVNVRFFEVNTL